MANYDVVPAEKNLEIDGLSIALRCWGNEKNPKVLALHGWLDNAASFDRLAPLLEGYYVVCLDFVGHGLSAHRPQQCTTHFIDHISDVGKVVQALNWDEYILMGHSMGAAVASYFASVMPQAIMQLILIEGLGSVTTAPDDAPHAMANSLRQQLRPRKSSPRYKDIDAAIKARQQGIGGLSYESAAILCNRGVKEVAGGVSWRADPRLRYTSMVRFSDEHVWAFLQALKMPVLLIRGSDGFLDDDHSYRSRQQFVEDLKVVEIPGGHHLHLQESPEQVAEVVKSFLQNKNN